jgi:integrase
VEGGRNLETAATRGTLASISAATADGTRAAAVSTDGRADMSGPAERETFALGGPSDGVLAVPPVPAEPVLTSTGTRALAATDPDHQLSEDAAALVARGLADNTRAAYERHWAPYERWCHLRGRTPLPATAETLAEYVHHLTSTTTQYGGPPSPSTINHVLGCIQAVHKHTGQISDVRLARLALRAYRREASAAQGPSDSGEGTARGGRRGRQRSAPVAVAQLRILVFALLAAVGAGRLHPIKGQRDHVALVLAFAMASRASEITTLDIADLAFSNRGLAVTVRSSKTDQDAVGVRVHIKYGKHLETCPVRLTQAWIDTLTAHGITSGPFLRGVDRKGRLAGTPGYAGRTRSDGIATPMTNDALNDLLRAAVDLARASDPDHNLEQSKDYSWHGLRAGFATSAAEAGAAPTAIADHGRWKGLLMVMHYWRSGTAWANNALDKVDL